jgi:hypothetical protein
LLAICSLGKPSSTEFQPLTANMTSSSSAYAVYFNEGSGHLFVANL